jgi:branched-chain amino acid transport system permease protein
MGHLSFGHMLYFGAGAYGTAIWLVYANANPFPALMAGIFTGAVISAFLGFIALQTRGASFALINMAFNEIGFFLTYSALSGYTHGEDGLICSSGKLFGIIDLYNEFHAFVFVLVILLLVFRALKALSGSPFGVLVRSVKEDENRVKFLGYNTMIYKWIVFVSASTLAALAGGMFALVQGFVSPGVISPFGNVEIIFAVLIGGAGNFYGALIGGVVFMLIKKLLPVFIPELEKLVQFSIPQWEMWLGIVLLIIVFALREGIVGFIRQKWQNYRIGKVTL